MLAAVALGVAVLAVSSTVWVRATATSPIDAEVPVAVTGGVVAPAVSAGGLVVLAAAAALTLGGRWGRRVAAAGIALGGALVLGGAVGALGEPGRAARTAAQAAVGVDALGGPAELTALPWVALALGAAAAALGMWTMVVAGRWGRTTRRHEDPVGAAASDGGSDGGHSDPAQPPAGPNAASAEGLEEHAAWDALTRGDDPT